MLHFLPPAPAHPEHDDAALVHRIAAGERAALEQAYRHEAPGVYRYALALCGNAGWAADAMQDAFVALAAQADAFDPRRGSLGAWLAGVARHALLAQWRREARGVPIDGADDSDEGSGLPGDLSATAESPEAVLVREQDGLRVLEALRRLPFAQREAVVLVDLQDRSYDAAARIAGVELNTLRTRLHRGRARLAQWLA